MTFHRTLMEKFPMRRSKEEKQAFRTWASAQFKSMGWEARTEVTAKGQHHNLVVGDPEHAAVVFTAHYDTPANMFVPNLMTPHNIPASILYTTLVIGALVVLSLIPALAVGVLTHNERAASLAFLLPYFGLLLLMSYAMPNRNNANDNTSGVAVLLQLAQTIPQEQREKCAFILFDNEERGKLGSKQYAKDHLQLQFMRLIVNLDCVGNGDHLLMIVRDMARKCTGYGLLEKHLRLTTGLTTHVFSAKTSRMNSDQSNFKCGIGLCACRKLPLLGYATGRIHTRHDTVCSQQNLDALTQALSGYVVALHTGI